jgi:hypothetical protein
MKLVCLIVLGSFVLLPACRDDNEPETGSVCKCTEMTTTHFQDEQEISSETIQFEYTDGRLTSILRNGKKDLVMYDAEGRIIRIEYNYIPLISRTFTYDQDKLIETKTGGSCACSSLILPTTYEYNPSRQLIKRTSKSGGGPEYPIEYVSTEYHYSTTADKQPLRIESSLLGTVEITYDNKKRPFENVHPMIMDIPGLPFLPSINNVVSLTGMLYGYSCDITYNDQGYPVKYDVQNNFAATTVKNIFKYDCRD